MPYSEKQIVEWAKITASRVFANADPVRLQKLEHHARALIAAVRKETREECARVCEEIWKRELQFQYGQRLSGPGIASDCATAIRNLQEREEGKR